MPNVSTPNCGWVIVKIGGTDPHYRIFGCWTGGYLNGDSWKLNSGIAKVEDRKGYYDFHGSSGSIYQCQKGSYGRLSGYCLTVLETYAQDGVEVFWDLPDVMNMDWIIDNDK